MKKKDGYDKLTDAEKKEYDAVMKRKMSDFKGEGDGRMKKDMDKRDKAGYFKMSGKEKENYDKWEKKSKGKREDEENMYEKKKE